jgi:hypothetical protein
MLGIWEYFWDLVDWAGAAPTNICRVTATVNELVLSPGTVSSVITRTAPS